VKCKVLPYKRKNIISAQDLEQKVGWGIQTLNVPETWKYSEGEGITIAVIDSGCDLSHTDLKDNLLEGFNFLNKKATPDDDCGHGSHLTGIICALNNNLGIVGVAPKAKVMPLKVLDEDGTGEMKNVAKAIRYATERKVDFILMSLGCPQPLQQVRKAIQAALNEGIVTFVAAGNMGKSEHLLYPANYKETISVGAIDCKMRRADFNNTGDNLDFLAPGVEILSTVPTNWYAIMSGSSQAAPFVLGLAALLKSYKMHKKIKINLDGPEDYRKVFKKYTMNVVGEDYAGDESKFYQGFGIITPAKMASLIESDPELFT
jgi:major intracellular serine protease